MADKLLYVADKLHPSMHPSYYLLYTQTGLHIHAKGPPSNLNMHVFRLGKL